MKSPILAMKPELLPFATRTKKDLGKEGTEGMFIDEVRSVSGDRPSKAVEWVSDSKASRHFCNDLSLLWDVRVTEDPIVLGQLSCVLRVNTLGTMKLVCKNKEDVPMVVELCNTLYTPQAVINLFNL